MESATVRCVGGSTTDQLAVVVQIARVGVVVEERLSVAALDLAVAGVVTCECGLSVVLIERTNGVRDVVQLGVDGNSDFAPADDQRQDGDGDDENQFDRDNRTVFVSSGNS